MLRRALLGLAVLACAPAAWAKTCAVTVTSDDQMRFDRKRIQVPADCSAVALTLRHSGTLAAAVMGHNWVLAKTADVPELANAGIAAGLAASYLPRNDARVLAHTRVIGGGQSDTVTFSTAALRKGGAYSFFCSFPGHWTLMQGTFVFG